MTQDIEQMERFFAELDGFVKTRLKRVSPSEFGTMKSASLFSYISKKRHPNATKRRKRSCKR
jgi:hypothetical protein